MQVSAKQRRVSVGFIVVALLGVTCTGCGEKGPVRVKVAGTVKYADGTIPAGEVAVIRFEPASAATGTMDPTTKAASGTIQPDGSYQLTTSDPGDGAFPGVYKVTFTVKEKYDAASPNLVDKKFESAATTPLEHTVKVGDTAPANFTVEKAK